MRYGGHETFPIRPNWLTLGLERLAAKRPGGFADPATADALGVGRNMAKSIGFWLRACGLTEPTARGDRPALSLFGRLVRRRDPYLQHDATWWALHANLAATAGGPAAWRWFFGRFDASSFGREGCEAAFKSFAAEAAGRKPSETTLRRDVACLLASYARQVPAERVDPEDASECPLRRLGLLAHRRDADRYARCGKAEAVPPELIGYALSLGPEHESASNAGHDDVAFERALSGQDGPGRLYGLDAAGLAAALQKAEDVLGAKQIRAELLGGERHVIFKRRPPAAWLGACYDRLEARA